MITTFQKRLSNRYIDKAIGVTVPPERIKGDYAYAEFEADFAYGKKVSVAKPAGPEWKVTKRLLVVTNPRLAMWGAITCQSIVEPGESVVAVIHELGPLPEKANGEWIFRIYVLS